MTEESLKNLDVKTIMEVLPHRYPFLLVDRVIELIPGDRILAIKNVTMNEPFFQGHFPGEPVMPGVLILEALAQAGSLLFNYSADDGIPGEIIFLHQARPMVRDHREQSSRDLANVR